VHRRSHATDRGQQPGRFNNVDIPWAVRAGGRTVGLALTSDRGLDQLRADVIDPAGTAAADPLTDVAPRPTVHHFPHGLLVTHDEPENTGRLGRDPRNFSYISWPDVAEPLGLRIDTTAGNDPRLR